MSFKFNPSPSAVVAAIALVGLPIGGQMGLPDNRDREESHAIAVSQGERTRLGTAVTEDLAAHPGRTGVILLRNGRDAFAARAVLAELAEQSIDLQYYMFHHDTVGNLLIYEVIRAADRGVRVRMLIDDMYGNDGEDLWVALDAHPAIEVRLFNPWIRGESRNLQFLTRMSDINYRMHSKTYTVDNQVTILGGRNIGDEYFEADPDLSFADLDALAIGPAVQEVSSEFDEYWNSDYAYPVSILIREGSEKELEDVRSEKQAFFDKRSTSSYVEALRDSPLANALRNDALEPFWGQATIIHDSSEKRTQDEKWSEELLISQLAPYITAAKSDVVIVSPYFVPGAVATRELCKLSRDGVRVRVLTNSLVSNDVVAVHAGYSKYRKPLLRCGVELWELNEKLRLREQKIFTWLPGLSKSSLHAKTMMFDREIMFIGSFNFDQRSLHINNEIGILIENDALAGVSTDRFDEAVEEVAFRVTLESDARGREKLRWVGKEGSMKVAFDSEPYASFWLQAAVAVMRLLPIESQL
ncbi:MAG: phospholipase D family protein [Acidobacteriota bacterium]